MAKLLYITCDLRSPDKSPSLFVGSEFLTEYMKWNVGDEIHQFDIYRDYIQRIDEDVLNAHEKLQQKQALATLAADERHKIFRIWRVSEQFAQADKYVFATPQWNIGFPAQFNIYIESICVPGKTFKFTSSGHEGLLKDQGKKCLHIHTSNGFYTGKHEKFTISYFNFIMNFMGIENIESIIIQCDEIHPNTEQSKRTMLSAVKEAKIAAKFF